MMLNHKKIPKNIVLSIVLALMISGLLGVSIPHYAYAHSLPVTETPVCKFHSPKRNTTAIKTHN